MNTKATGNRISKPTAAEQNVKPGASAIIIGQSWPGVNSIKSCGPSCLVLVVQTCGGGTMM